MNTTNENGHRRWGTYIVSALVLITILYSWKLNFFFFKLRSQRIIIYVLKQYLV